MVADSIETVVEEEEMMMVDDRVGVKEEAVVGAVEITFLNEMEIGHAVDVQIKTSHGEMNAIGMLNAMITRNELSLNFWFFSLHFKL